MCPNINGELPREGTVVIKDELESMSHNGHELDHLQSGQVLLPPKVLFVLRAHGRHHVVKVHHHVDKRVEQPEKGTVTSAHVAGAGPNGHGHDSVMDHV